MNRSCLISRHLERFGVGLAGADAQRADKIERRRSCRRRSGRSCAASAMASTTLSASPRVDGDLDLQLRQEAHGVFGAAVDLRVALLAAVALDFGDGQTLHAEAVSASRTASSLNGLMMAMMSFIRVCSLTAPARRPPSGGRRRQPLGRGPVQDLCQAGDALPVREARVRGRSRSALAQPHADLSPQGERCLR